VNGLPVLVAVMFLNKALLELKTSIPAIHPFDWDETFASLDRTLHFGIDPWVLLQTVMGHAGITFVGNIFYSLWFFVMFGALLWFGFQNQAGELRSRFFLSYMLLWWIGGGLLSVYFSSAGPAFYGALGLPNDPYVGLMSYLHDADARMPVFSLAVQQHLWDGYQGREVAIGISAFPSMHNGSAFLVALAFRPISRVLSNIFFGFTAIIFMTSIHLGWHYAVDGYAAFALAGLIWWISGPIVGYLHRQQSMRRFNDELAVFSAA
jgi:PAP2 superfamily